MLPSSEWYCLYCLNSICFHNFILWRNSQLADVFYFDFFLLPLAPFMDRSIRPLLVTYAQERREKDSFFNVRIVFVLILSNLSFDVLTLCRTQFFYQIFPYPMISWSQHWFLLLGQCIYLTFSVCPGVMPRKMG